MQLAIKRVDFLLLFCCKESIGSVEGFNFTFAAGRSEIRYGFEGINNIFIWRRTGSKARVGRGRRSFSEKSLFL